MPKTKTPVPQTTASLFNRLAKKTGLARLAYLYAAVAVLILLSTTLLWTILGANLQQSNADQLVNSSLFQNLPTIHQALLPSSHSFLIKWQLLLAVKLLGYSTGSYIAMTTLAVLVTVALLVFILYRIECRPLVFGTLCLALASVLLLIPTQPAAGAPLPVNMAMLATRNLEYAVYIGALLLFIRARHLRDWRFWLAAIVLGILIASDKLFLILPLTAASIGLVIYTLKHKWPLASLSSIWLIGGLAAGLIGLAGLSLINASGFTHLTAGTGGLPYALVSSSKNLALGVLYGGLGIATNFGANPAYDATVVRNIPHQFFARLFSLDGPAYLVNIIILATGLVLAY